MKVNAGSGVFYANNFHELMFYKSFLITTFKSILPSNH